MRPSLHPRFCCWTVPTACPRALCLRRSRPAGSPALGKEGAPGILLRRLKTSIAFAVGFTREELLRIDFCFPHSLAELTVIP